MADKVVPYNPLEKSNFANENECEDSFFIELTGDINNQSFTITALDTLV